MRNSYHISGEIKNQYSQEVADIVHEINDRFGLTLEYDSEAGVWLVVTSQPIPAYFLRKLTEAGTTYQDLSVEGETS